MRVRAFRRFGDTRTVVVEDVSVVLLENDEGDALAVACRHAGGNLVCHAGEPDFNKVLHNLGFDKLTIVDTLTDKQLVKTPGELSDLPSVG